MRRKLKLQSDPYTPRVPSNRRIVHNGLMSYWQYGKCQCTVDGVDEFVDVGVLSGILPALTTDYKHLFLWCPDEV